MIEHLEEQIRIRRVIMELVQSIKFLKITV